MVNKGRRRPENIVNGCKVALFAGAGASSPLGLKTTVEFLPFVKDHVKEDKSLLQFRVGELSKEINQGTLIDELDFIYSQAASTYGVEEGTVDSEIVLDYLSRLEEACSIVGRGPKHFMLLSGSGVDPGQAEVWRWGVEACRNFLLKIVTSHYADVNPEDCIRIYRTLVTILIHSNRSENGRSSTLPVFTTNYDWAFETIADALSLGLVDGFPKGGGQWNPENFFTTPREDNMALFKLHGSTSWRQYPSKPAFKIEEAEFRPGRAENLLIWPTQSKSDKLNQDPFNTLVNLFGVTLKEVQLCVVVGFSFRDLEINSVFKQSLAQNSKLQLIVVDPCFRRADGRELEQRILHQLGLSTSEQEGKVLRIGGYWGHPRTEKTLLGAIRALLNGQPIQDRIIVED